MLKSPFFLFIVLLATTQVKRKWQYYYTVCTGCTANFISIVIDIPARLVCIVSSLFPLLFLRIVLFLLLFTVCVVCGAERVECPVFLTRFGMK